MTSPPDKTTSIGGIGILIVFVSTVLVQLFSIRDIETIHSAYPPLFPLLSEVFQNVIAAFNGYPGGYLRTLIGYAVFVLMVMFFLSAGKIILDAILPRDLNAPDSQDLSLLERMSLYYLLGSLVSSLLWLLLGLMGFLNLTAASFLCALGLALFYHQFHVKQSLKTSINLLRAWAKESSWLEKAMGAFILGFVMLTSARSILCQGYSDSLQIHLPLPALYICRSKVSFIPHFIYSYFPQNTEMLMVWALLFKSETAAALLIWGFYASLVFFVLGFFRRFFGNLSAMCTSLIICTAPIAMWFGMTIKNDWPAAVFIFAGYGLMLEALNSWGKDSNRAKKWGFLSGILAGGAVGHKLTCLLPMGFSFLALSGYEFFTPQEKAKRSFVSLVYLLGSAVVMFPWLIRTFWETGNPVYPYLHKFFSSGYVKDWHALAVNVLGQSGGSSFKDYFSILLGSPKTTNSLSVGPPAVFLLFLPIGFIRNVPLQIKTVVLAASAAWMAGFFISFEIRYQIGPLMILICFAFAIAFESVSRRSKIAATVIAAVVAASSIQNILFSRVYSATRLAWSQLLSGFSNGNRAFTSDVQQVNLQWMSHLINTRTRKWDTVLLAGLMYGYGLERKFLFGNYPDKPILQDLAEQSKDETELKDRLKALGVNHVLMIRSFFQSRLNPTTHPLLRTHEKDLLKIDVLLEKEMRLRFTTPDETMGWYSMKEDPGLEPVILNQKDAEAYPIMYLLYADWAAERGQKDRAKEMYETIIKGTVSMDNKKRAASKLTHYPIFGPLL